MPDGPLSGLPYAAKDMFQAPGRRPTWGLGGPRRNVPDTPKADVLDRLDRAGACRVGFTRMTALAYEPSGINPLQGAPVNPWNRDVVPRGVVIGLGGGGRERGGLHRPWVGHGRFAPDPGARVRAHRLEADMGRGARWRRHAACAQPRHDWPPGAQRT